MIIAPVTLVAAKVVIRRMSAVKTVPIIPVKTTVIREHAQPLLLMCAVKNGVIKRYAAAIPKSTHKITGVIVITAVKRRSATAIPTTMLATAAKNGQEFFIQQFVFIFSPLTTLYDKDLQMLHSV